MALTRHSQVSSALPPLRRQQVTRVGVGLYRHFHDTALRADGRMATVIAMLFDILRIA